MLPRLILACVLLAPFGAAAQEQIVRIGMARSVSNGAELIAIEKGYFKDHNIKVEIEPGPLLAMILPLSARRSFTVSFRSGRSIRL